MIKAIHSGGQTGADLGGLIAGIELGLRTGGWAPAGFRTEDGSRPELGEIHGLKAHKSRAYQPRTKLNVSETDGTFWFGNPHSAGGKLTLGTARKMRKPLFVVEWRSGWPDPHPEDTEDFLSWVAKNQIETLNVAGNRESSQPGIRVTVANFLLSALM